MFGATFDSDLSQSWTEAWLDTLKTMVDGGLRSLTLHASSMKTAIVHGISQVSILTRPSKTYDINIVGKQEYHTLFPVLGRFIYHWYDLTRL